MSKLVTVATFEHVIEADALKMELENEGFQAFVTDDAVVSNFSILSNAVGGVKVQVPESQAKMAKSIVAKHENFRQIRKERKASMPDVSFDCEECGKPLTFPGARRGGIESCPHCNEYIDVPD